MNYSQDYFRNSSEDFPKNSSTNSPMNFSRKLSKTLLRHSLGKYSRKEFLQKFHRGFLERFCQRFHQKSSRHFSKNSFWICFKYSSSNSCKYWSKGIPLRKISSIYDRVPVSNSPMITSRISLKISPEYHLKVSTRKFSRTPPNYLPEITAGILSMILSGIPPMISL